MVDSTKKKGRGCGDFSAAGKLADHPTLRAVIVKDRVKAVWYLESKALMSLVRCG